MTFAFCVRARALSSVSVRVCVYVRRLETDTINDVDVHTKCVLSFGCHRLSNRVELKSSSRSTAQSNFMAGDVCVDVNECVHKSRINTARKERTAWMTSIAWKIEKCWWRRRFGCALSTTTLTAPRSDRDRGEWQGQRKMTPKSTTQTTCALPSDRFWLCRSNLRFSSHSSCHRTEKKKTIHFALSKPLKNAENVVKINRHST